MLFVLSFLIDVYIYSDVRTATRKRGARLAYVVSTLLCWSLLVVIMCMPKRSEESDLLPVMWMLYTYLSIYMGKIGYVLCSLAGRFGSLFEKKKVIRPTGERLRAEVHVYVVWW